MVSPTAVVLGPLPMFPLLAALPDNGTPAAWTVWLMAVPPLLAALAAARAQRRHPTIRWEEGALRGCTGGVLAGVVVGILANLAGGAVGPGRMRARRAVRLRRAGARDHGVRHRRALRRPRHDLVAASRRPGVRLTDR